MARISYYAGGTFHSLRCTDFEATRIHAKARDAGVTVSAYLRRCAEIAEALPSLPRTPVVRAHALGHLLPEMCAAVKESERERDETNSA